ncbi:phage portal protein [Thiotrichales bacterium 19X7-9]|nr:phage portal protein [Thiotrichales bacterium 19X7-9]
MKLPSFFRKKSSKSQVISNRRIHRDFDAVDSQLMSDISNLYISNSDINDVISRSWYTIASRARQAYNNSDYPKHFVSLACVNVIGQKGINVQCQSNSKELNLDVEGRFKQWSETCDVSGRLSFIDVQILALKSMIRDGEFFLIKHIDDDNQLKLQLIDASRLDPSKNIDLGNGRKILNGIEVDTLGKPLAYHFKKNNANETIRYKAEHVVHGYLSDYIGQMRGISWFITPMIRLHLLKEFETAAVDHAKTGAKFLGFFRRDEDAPDSDDTPEIHKYEGSGMFELPPGYQFDGFDPAFPSGDYAPFKTSILQAISGSLGYGVSYVSLANDLKGVSYSSARQAALAERDAWSMIQQHMISCLIRPIYRAWLEVERLSGRLVCSDNRYQGLKLAHYIPRSWSWIDPQKEAKALEILLKNFLKSRKQIVTEQGMDIDKVDQEILQDANQFKLCNDISPEYVSYLLGTLQMSLEEDKAEDDDGKDDEE